MAKGETYEEFVDKFKNKKTTDDCYTPPDIYKIISNYFCEKLNLDKSKIIRPFYPGGDYEHEDYTDKIVLDNQPFSKTKEILNFYLKNNVPYILFADGRMLCDTIRKHPECGACIIKRQIEYENKAKVQTVFISNMWKGIVLDGELQKLLDDYYKEHSKKKPKDERKENQYSSIDLCNLVPKDGKTIKVIKNYHHDNKCKTGKALYGGAIVIDGGDLK